MKEDSPAVGRGSSCSGTSIVRRVKEHQLLQLLWAQTSRTHSSSIFHTLSSRSVIISFFSHQFSGHFSEMIEHDGWTQQLSMATIMNSFFFRGKSFPFYLFLYQATKEFPSKSKKKKHSVGLKSISVYRNNIHTFISWQVEKILQEDVQLWHVGVKTQERNISSCEPRSQTRHSSHLRKVPSTPPIQASNKSI